MKKIHLNLEVGKKEVSLKKIKYFLTIIFLELVEKMLDDFLFQESEIFYILNVYVQYKNEFEFDQE
jgi:hypothetical protein